MNDIFYTGFNTRSMVLNTIIAAVITVVVVYLAMLFAVGFIVNILTSKAVCSVLFFKLF